MTLIKIHLARLLFFPSFLCLDAPLAALGWALCLSADLGEPGRGAFCAAAVALFLCVWLVYLFDRLYDVSRIGGARQLTPRHEWARHHRLELGGFFLAALVAFLAVVPKLETKTILAGLVLGLVTGLYYLAFRFSNSHSRLRGVMPFKEFTIALCFAAGILLAAAPSAFTAGLVPLVVGYVSLFTANCLVISRAERGSDLLADSAAYFSYQRQPSSLPEWGALFAAGCGMITFMVATVGDRSSLSLFFCGLFTFFIAGRGTDEVRLTQPLADWIQMIPWLALGTEGVWKMVFA